MGERMGERMGSISAAGFGPLCCMPLIKRGASIADTNAALLLELPEWILDGLVFQTLCRYDTESKHGRRKDPLP